MSKVEEYRTSAADTLRLAQSASYPEDKTRLLGMAGAWLDLADRVGRRSRITHATAHSHPDESRIDDLPNSDRSSFA